MIRWLRGMRQATFLFIVENDMRDVLYTSRIDVCLSSTNDITITSIP